jgi:MFS family permease
MSGRFAAFKHVSYQRYFVSRFGAALAGNILSVTVAWQIYAETGNPLYLGWIGLVQFLPSLLLVLVTGLAADKLGRRVIMGVSIFLQMSCGLTLLAMTALGQFSVLFVLTVVTIMGIARAFYSPSVNSLVVNIVPREDFPNAVSWNASSWQMATILGPAIGGALTAVSINVAYGVAAIVSLCTAVLIFTIPKPEQARDTSRTTLTTLLSGFSYVWKTKIVLGAMSLDLFAVLLGGAVALLPVYAKDVLEIGEFGYGVLRAAPGIGAMLMVLVITSFEEACGFDPVCVYGAVWRYACRVRVFPIGLAVGLSTRLDRGLRHDLCLCTGNIDPALDAGWCARARECRKLNFYRRLQSDR